MEVDVDVESVFDDAGSNKLAPPLTIISLAIRTVVHVVTNTSEIVCATARVWKDCESALKTYRVYAFRSREILKGLNFEFVYSQSR